MWGGYIFSAFFEYLVSKFFWVRDGMGAGVLFRKALKKGFPEMYSLGGVVARQKKLFGRLKHQSTVTHFQPVLGGFCGVCTIGTGTFTPPPPPPHVLWPMGSHTPRLTMPERVGSLLVGGRLGRMEWINEGSVGDQILTKFWFISTSVRPGTKPKGRNRAKPRP